MDWAKEIGAANLEYCEYCAKWGMPVGSLKFAGGGRALAGIAAQAEQRVRDEVAAGELRPAPADANVGCIGRWGRYFVHRASRGQQ
jgi:hypothetical protein